MVCINSPDLVIGHPDRPVRVHYKILTGLTAAIYSSTAAAAAIPTTNIAGSCVYIRHFKVSSVILRNASRGFAVG